MPKYRARAARIQMSAEWESAAETPRRQAWPTVPRVATMKAAIMVLECPGSRACSAPNTSAVAMSQKTEECWTRSRLLVIAIGRS